MTHAVEFDFQADPHPNCLFYNPYHPKPIGRTLRCTSIVALTINNRFNP